MTEINPAAFERWRRILLVMCVVFAIQALTWPLFGSFDPIGFYDGYMAKSLWNLEALPADAQRAFAFVLIPFGATTAAFFVLSGFVVYYAFPRRERWAFDAVVVAVLVWFVIDTGLCLMRGAWFNVIIVNVPFLAVLSVPLIALRPYFRRSTAPLA